MTANLPVLSGLLTRTVRKLSYRGISDEGSPEAGTPDGQSQYSVRSGRFFKSKPSNSAMETQPGFCTDCPGGRPTVRHHFEYGKSSLIEVHEHGNGKVEK